MPTFQHDTTSPLRVPHFPPETWELVFFHLTGKDLLAVAAVCQDFNELGSNIHFQKHGVKRRSMKDGVLKLGPALLPCLQRSFYTPPIVELTCKFQCKDGHLLQALRILRHIVAAPTLSRVELDFGTTFLRSRGNHSHLQLCEVAFYKMIAAMASKLNGPAICVGRDQTTVHLPSDLWPGHALAVENGRHPVPLFSPGHTCTLQMCSLAPAVRSLEPGYTVMEINPDLHRVFHLGSSKFPDLSPSPEQLLFLLHNLTIARIDQLYVDEVRPEVLPLVMSWLWPEAKKPRLFGFGTKAKPEPKPWPGLAFGLAWDLSRPKPKITPFPCQKPRLPGFQAKARGWLGFGFWPGLGIIQAKARQSRAKAMAFRPSQSQNITNYPYLHSCSDIPPFAPSTTPPTTRANGHHEASSRPRSSSSATGLGPRRGTIVLPPAPSARSLRACIGFALCHVDHYPEVIFELVLSLSSSVGWLDDRMGHKEDIVSCAHRRVRRITLLDARISPARRILGWFENLKWIRPALELVIVPDPAELEESGRWREFIHEVQTKFPKTTIRERDEGIVGA
ncbi:hypothetical protein C8R46DRAFT_1301900 [Mycena filopes]|nr:hypothetical protein C8R46DRAFT_1301900 [Mycena filopes]